MNLDPIISINHTEFYKLVQFCSGMKFSSKNSYGKCSKPGLIFQFLQAFGIWANVNLDDLCTRVTESNRKL